MSNTQFADKVIAITGAASGIGFEAAKLLASRGAKLSLADLTREGLEAAQKAIQAQNSNVSILIYPLDVRQYDQVEAWIAETVKYFGRLDGAANMAGVVSKTIGSDAAKIEQMDLKDWEWTMGINSTGVLHCLKAQLQKIADNGSVVNASSIAGVQGREKNGAYTASKHAVIGLTRSAAKEVGDRGVRVNAICPGRIDTPMSRGAAEAAKAIGKAEEYAKETISDCALRRKGRPEEVAHLIAFLLSDESTYITGNAVSIDGGWNC